MINKPHITLMMTLWGRPEVFRVVLQGLNRFMHHPDVETSIVFVLSEEDEHRKVLLKIIAEANFDYEVIYCPNDQLGAKHNAGIKEALKGHPDYVMNIGSDDLLHPSLWDLYLPFILEKYHLIGLRKLYFYSPPDESIHFAYSHEKHLVVGAGRLMHAGMLKQIWKKEKQLYTHNCQRGLDTDSTYKMYTHGCRPLVLDPGMFPMIVDIKTEDNINAMDRIRSSRSYNVIKEVESEMLKVWFPELKELDTRREIPTSRDRLRAIKDFTHTSTLRQAQRSVYGSKKHSKRR